MGKKISFLSITATTALALSLTLAGCSSKKEVAASTASNGYQKTEIKLSHVASENTPKGQSALKFKEIVESKSNGEVKVDIYPNGQLYGDNDEIEALQANNVQMIAPSAAKLSGFEESYEIFDLPFMFKDSNALYKFEDGEGGKKLLSKLDNAGMVGLDFWPNGFKHVTNNKKEVTKPTDLKGLKIRTHGGTIINEVYNQLGAGSSKIAFNETYQALQLGTVDGQENSLINFESQKYFEVQKYLTLSGHARSEYILLANKNWWSSLNDKTKGLIEEAVGESTKLGRELEAKYETEAMDKIKQSGRVKIHELTDDERQAFVNSLSTVNNKWGNKMDSEILQKAKEANQ